MSRMTSTRSHPAPVKTPSRPRRRRRAAVALLAPLALLVSLVVAAPAVAVPERASASGTGAVRAVTVDAATSGTPSDAESTAPSAGYSGNVDGPHQDTDKEQTGQDVSTGQVVLIGLIVLAALAVVIALIVRRRRQLRR